MMSSRIIFFAAVVVLARKSTGFNYDGDTVVVSVPPQGDFRGRRYQMDDTGDFSVNFFGRVPFAAPPVGDLRFRPPGAAPTWEGERDSTYYGPACPQLGSIFYNFSLPTIPLPTAAPPIGPPSPFPQYSFMEAMVAAELQKIIAPEAEPPITLPDPLKDRLKDLIGNLPIDLEKIIGTIRNISQSNFTTSDILNEDCLYMNIYAPEEKGSTEKYPVMLFIQGGAWNIGTAMYLYDGRILAERKKVVVVTFNYRLGALGYLSTMDEVSPGNYGMLDQVAAMEWVRDNIEYFGGDKNSITLFGQSAGAASVGYHLLSPMSEGIFHRAIQQSGSPLNPWAAHVPPYDPLNSTYSLADNIGCPRQPHTDLLDCLMTKDALEISHYSPSSNYDNIAFAPVVDGVFLLDEPLTLMKNGAFYKVPLMMGYTKNETSPVTYLSLDDPQNGVIRDEFRRYLRGVAEGRPYYSYDPYYEDVEKALEYAYTPWEDPEDQILLREALLRFLDERLFHAGVHWQAKMASKAGMDTFVYRFDHKGNFFPDLFGVVHTVDLTYTFGTPYMPDKYSFLNWTDADIDVTDTVQDLWYNFATTGNPTAAAVPGADGDWEKYTRSNQRMFHIQHPTSRMENGTVDSYAHAYWMVYDPEVVKSASRSREPDSCEECPTPKPCDGSDVSAGCSILSGGVVLLSLIVAALNVLKQ